MLVGGRLVLVAGQPRVSGDESQDGRTYDISGITAMVQRVVGVSDRAQEFLREKAMCSKRRYSKAIIYKQEQKYRT